MTVSSSLQLPWSCDEDIKAFFSKDADRDLRLEGLSRYLRKRVNGVSGYNGFTRELIFGVLSKDYCKTKTLGMGSK
jgi:hypothetical protein